MAIIEYDDVDRVRQDILQHLLECTEFEQITSYPNFRTLQKVIQCNCGKEWTINNSLMRRTKEKWDSLCLFFRNGNCRRDNIQFMEQLKAHKASILRQEKIEKIEKHDKNVKHPIFSLELELSIGRR